ncbi:limonene-1,2-epoxide hydrolase family protein [Streptomyces sp. NPDC005303]|uniref:limonene-1,2-epoxide hydrolase family protein n=1 Tax=Streptomyces sp. NPDC005303 TaxID=3155713 RepID=UPI0033B14791
MNIAAVGNVVLNERVDDFHHSSGRVVSLPVMETITVEDGMITVWRDYFDPTEMKRQLAEIKR